jgi:CheY-like chemotaxis protein
MERGETFEGVVLLVERDEAFREVIQFVLERAGYLVLPARDCSEAMARIRGLGGRVITVIDLAPQGVHARRFVKLLRADVRLAATRVLVLTSLNRPHIDGVDRVLLEPFGAETVLAAVQELSHLV